MKKSLWVALASLLILSAGFVAAAEKKTGMAKMPEHSMYAPADIKWMDAPPVLPAGAKAAVLEGNPSKAGYFAMRLKIQPHWHPNVERVTVISGTLGIGVGDTFDPSKGHEMSAGTYASMQPKVHHFAWTKGETEIQLTTIGPWKLVYVNPKDDPSKMAKK